MTLTPQIIDNAIKFLARVDLKGAEAPALMEVVSALQALARQPPEPNPPQPKPLAGDDLHL